MKLYTNLILLFILSSSCTTTQQAQKVEENVSRKLKLSDEEIKRKLQLYDECSHAAVIAQFSGISRDMEEKCSQLEPDLHWLEKMREKK